ncbi:MAG: ATP synthase F1 subunit epsilon [bacterium]|nr:ATP synthase F1 subunit epsilon [bacterium]
MNLEIVTKQEKIFESDNTLQVTVPTIEGEITILPNHQNLVTILAIGEVNIVTALETKKIFIDKGIIEVSDNKVSILVDRGVPSEKAIKEEIEKAVKKAEEKYDKETMDEETLIQLERQLKFERFVRDKVE